MSLSQKTIKNLANALKEDVITYIEDSEEYAEILMYIIRDFLTLKFGEMDENLKDDISLSILDAITIQK